LDNTYYINKADRDKYVRDILLTTDKHDLDIVVYDMINKIENVASAELKQAQDDLRLELDKVKDEVFEIDDDYYDFVDQIDNATNKKEMKALQKELDDAITEVREHIKNELKAQADVETYNKLLADIGKPTHALLRPNDKGFDKRITPKLTDNAPLLHSLNSALAHMDRTASELYLPRTYDAEKRSEFLKDFDLKTPMKLNKTLGIF
jgi:hypothetical protein